MVHSEIRDYDYDEMYDSIRNFHIGVYEKHRLIVILRNIDTLTHISWKIFTYLHTREEFYGVFTV